MTDPFAELEEEVIVPEMVQEPRPVVLDPSQAGRGITRAERLRTRAQQLQDEIEEENLRVVRDVAMAQDIDPDEDAPPEEWVKKYGAKEAERKFRVAKAGWSNKTPNFIRQARDITVGIAKAKALSKGPDRSLNAGVVAVNMPIQNMNVIIVDD